MVNHHGRQCSPSPDEGAVWGRYKKGGRGQTGSFRFKNFQSDEITDNLFRTQQCPPSDTWQHAETNDVSQQCGRNIVAKGNTNMPTNVTDTNSVSITSMKRLFYVVLINDRLFLHANWKWTTIKRIHSDPSLNLVNNLSKEIPSWN